MARLLIVDDDAEFSATLASMLERSGHVVATHATMAGTLEKARACQPELLILDMMFPENQLGGQVLARDVRHDPELQHLPIVFLSSIYEYFPRTFAPDPTEDCRPIQDFIEKPVALPDLLRRVRDALRPHPPAWSAAF
jgi:CheY-like chemotaxis protein